MSTQASRFATEAIINTYLLGPSRGQTIAFPRYLKQFGTRKI